MNLKQKLKNEAKAIGWAMLYFGSWIGALVLLKQLVLAEYEIAFHGLTAAVVGVLIISKVVLVLEHVPLGAWVSGRAAWVDVVLRTALYSFGVLIVLVLERGFEGRHEHGGFGASLTAAFEGTDVHHIWVNAIGLGGALLGFNALSVVRRHLGEGALLGLFLVPMQRQEAEKNRQ